MGGKPWIGVGSGLNVVALVEGFSPHATMFFKIHRKL
jgi:hypothetical protein